MSVIATLIGGVLGGLEVWSGFVATHSYWSYGVTMSLALITGIIVGRLVAEL